MKIMVKSKQIYEDCVEEIIKEYDDADVSYDDEKLFISHDDGSMEFDFLNDEASIVSPNNNLKIKINEKKVLTYETSYGKITLETCGNFLEFDEVNFIVRLSYLITMNSGISYMNEVTVECGERRPE